MKHKLVLVALIGSNIFAVRQDYMVARADQKQAFEYLMEYKNEQTIAIMSAMATVGLNALLKNMTNICPSDGIDCLRISLPLMAFPVLSYMVYKTIKRKKA